jgi:hypothetical protein
MCSLIDQGGGNVVLAIIDEQPGQLEHTLKGLSTGQDAVSQRWAVVTKNQLELLSFASKSKCTGTERAEASGDAGVRQ